MLSKKIQIKCPSDVTPLTLFTERRGNSVNMRNEEKENMKTVREYFYESKKKQILKQQSKERQNRSVWENEIEQNKVKEQDKQKDLMFQQQFQRNKGKIDRLSHKLQELYMHYRVQECKVQQMQEGARHIQKVISQNELLSSQIMKIRNMVKNVLLDREKGKLNRLVK